MNRSDVLDSLSAIFGNFIVFSLLFDDISEIISKSGCELDFFNVLLTRLKYLAEYGTSAFLVFPKIYEHLRKSNGLYSMHVDTSNMNVRILYAFLPNGAPILLHAFYERAGKRKTDYTQSITIAEQRLKEYLKENHYE